MNRAYQITFKSSQHESLLIYKHFLEKLLKNTKAEYSFFHLPMKRKMVTVLKSPHVHKKAQEHFEIRHHKFCVDVDFSKSFTERKQDSLISLFYLNKPANIFLSVKIKTSPKPEPFDPLKLNSETVADTDDIVAIK